MNKSVTRPGIFKKKRYTPVHNLRGDEQEVKKPQEYDLSWAADHLRQCELLMEIEDMENDRMDGAIFGERVL